MKKHTGVGESPFPHSLPNGKVVKDERCQCGMLRSQHGPGRFGAFGHGECTQTGCVQFTWKERIYV
jgi:hypothetical protein